MPAPDARATLIINPTAGRGRCARALPRIRRVLSNKGVDATYLFTGARGDAERLANESLASGASLVVAVGGDGTLHEVANALLKAVQSKATLGLIPFGTGNDFARAVGLFGSVETACIALVNGKRTPIDVGTIEGRGIENPYYFLVAAGVGFVAETAKTVNEGIRWLHGAPAYIYGALQTLRRFDPISLTITIDDKEPEALDAMLISVSNVATTGGGMRIAPDARPDDGLLDICLVEKIGKMALVGQLPGVFAGKHVRHPAVRMMTARTVRIETESPKILWIDGEVIGTTPATFKILAGALPIMLLGKP
jgi:diacylglycerol kinase (ATP)